MGTYNFLIAGKHDASKTAKHYHGDPLSTINDSAKNNIPSDATVSSVQIHFKGSVSSGDTKFYIGFTNDVSSKPGDILLEEQLTTTNSDRYVNINSYSSKHPFNISSSYSHLNFYASSGIIVKGYSCYDFSITYTYSLPTYTVTLNANGGYCSVASISRESGSTLGTVVSDSNIPTKTGHTFSYWSTDQAGANRVYSTTKVTGNLTLYAQYTVNSYTVTTNVSPVSYGKVSGGGSYNYGSTATLTASVVDDIYEFLNWNDGVIDATRTITVTGNVTYTAYFRLNAIFIDTSQSLEVFIDTEESGGIYADETKMYE